MNLLQAPVLIVDCQTTGASPARGRLLEIAWLIARADAIDPAEAVPNARAWIARQPAGEDVPRRIRELTGIGDDELAHAVDPLTIQLELSAAAKSGVVVAVAHFAQFERPFIQDLFKSAGEEFPLTWLCTHRIAKKLLPNLPAKGVRGLAGYFGARLRDETKRAGHHADATARIWAGLARALDARGVSTIAQVTEWLSETPAPRARGARKLSSYEYPMSRAKRLQFPDKPGVYRMLARDGEVLYVGKATSLKSRVNSYFRGRKGRDPRKLEMLTLAWDVRETVCETPLEAAVLENDEIKHHDPPYNVSLRARSRSLWFFSRDLRSCSPLPTPDFPVGPCGRKDEFDSLVALVDGARSGEFPVDLFWEPIEADLIGAGFAVFCERVGRSAETLFEARSALAFGVRNWRTHVRSRAADAHSEEAEEIEDIEDEAVDDGDVAPPTPAGVADRIERLLRRAGRSFALARATSTLLNSELDFVDLGEARLLALRRGRLHTETAVIVDRAPITRGALAWQGLGVTDFDRMKIVLSELARVARSGGRATARPMPSWPLRSSVGERVGSDAP